MGWSPPVAAEQVGIQSFTVMSCMEEVLDYQLEVCLFTAGPTAGPEVF